MAPISIERTADSIGASWRPCVLSKLPTTTRERDQTLMPRQMTPMRAFQPDYISPPGETLADMLEQSGMTQTELAQRLGVSLKHVNQVVKGAASISAELALGLEKVFGVSASFWLN